MNHNVFIYRVHGIPTLESYEDRTVIMSGRDLEVVKKDKAVKFSTHTERYTDSPPSAGDNLIIETVDGSARHYTYIKLNSFEIDPNSIKDEYVPIVLSYSVVSKTDSIC